jgi:A/G-specific adenine glycosylase
MSSLPATLADLHVKKIQRRLLAWGRENYKRYAWRDESDPWLTLVAEFLLQRTRARQVESVFLDFKSKYPTAEALVSAGPEAARRVLHKLGLHWRSPLLYKLAEDVADRGGLPPETEDELGRMLGVGPYTTAAWLSLHCGKRAVIIDANVSRFLSRLTGRKRPADDRHCAWLSSAADRLTPQRAFRAYNYAVLDFTMTVCTRVRPKCQECRLRGYCAYGRCQAP